MLIVNSLTRLALTVTFRDETGAATVPSSVSYTITDGGSTTIKAATPLEVSSSTAELVIPAADNACIVAGSTFERRRVVITAADLAQEVYEYRIERIG